MGLHVHSLGELPIEAERSYYVYVIDYGWHEPLGEALRANFAGMADAASRSEAVVLLGTKGSHFHDEVLSWHSVNGQRADRLLPAILITTRHPRHFRERRTGRRPRGTPGDYPLLLIPLKKVCKTSTDVADLISRIFDEIREKRRLENFSVAAQMKKGLRRALVNAAVLQPSWNGIGIDLKQLLAELQQE